jgi:type IV pilus assembly protein PilY1
MKSNRIFKRILASLMLAASFLMQASEAADIDIFVGASGGTAAAPNVIFLVDNSPNWSRQSQQWPDNGGNQGQAELAAITSILNTINNNTPMNIGYATLTAYAGSSSGGNTPGTGGGYIRFGVRDMSVAANRTALQNILTGINNNITDPNEKVNGMASKDEAAGFYEIYKYLSGLAPFSGIPAENVKADISGNGSSYTAFQQGLSSGFAYNSNGNYNSPITTSNPCAKTFIIYIANNANNSGSNGRASYQPSVISAGTALTATSGLDTWTDEWTKLLYTNGVVVPEGNNNGSVVTYVLDAYNKQQDIGYSNSLMNAAKVGGGRYFQVGSQAAILTALSTIFAEIQGVNSTFASASLPVNTTNRAQDKNQVFIPMFRPDANGAPRWMGNLKQYQFISNANSVDLGDMNGNVAVNPLTGFPNDCANSFWTTDSGSYWSNVIETPIPKGNCATSSNNAFSDAPDGPFVEKGGVAEVIRKGNNPQITNNTPTWSVNRTVYTLSGSSLTAFTSASSGLSSSVTNFILGYDVKDENGNGDMTETRPSLHGDTIHSRPVPVDYGGTTGVTVYYGSNDGNLRAVDTATGKERWSFIAPEFFGTLARLEANSPLVNYPSMPAGITPAPTAKDYYFDGTIGLYQNADNSKVWIYPTMRRGGRMIYAFDVTNPASPVFKWKVGCPNLANDTGCTAGMSGIGQTWSIPNVAAKVLGYTGPVIVVGGGYDNCDDANTSTPSCASGKGGIVYVLDAISGAVIRSFTTLRAVAADVALIGVANPGTVDYGYIADLGGNIYRLDFAASSANWAMNRIAYTNGAGRKFFYAPSLLPAPGNKVYLALGSGDREHPLQSQYPYGNVINRLYVILDDLASTSATNLDSTSSMKNFTSNTTCTTAGVLPTSSDKGWFMDLNQYGTGEQTVTSAVIIGGMIVLSTNRPVPAAEGSCNTSLGEARGYWLNLFNASGAIGVAEACGGTRSTTFVGGGLPPSPVFGVVSINGSPKSVIIGAVEKSGGASSAISPQQVKPPIRMNRKTIYWKSSGNN